MYFESLHCAAGHITTSSLFYHGYFAQIPIGPEDPNLIEEPGDWSRARTILEMGGKSARHPDMLMIKNGHRHCVSGRNRLYRPQVEPGPYKDIKNVKWNRPEDER